MYLAAMTVVAQIPESDYLLMPLVFEHQQTVNDNALASNTATSLNLDAGDEWLQQAIAQSHHYNNVRYRAMVEHPQLVAYNVNSLPEPPKEYVLTSTPAKGMLTIEAPQVVAPVDSVIDEAPVKVHNWLHTFNGSVHFTQAYISDNWYQGGENNLNVLADIKWECNLNQAVHPNWLFNNMMNYKLGITTASGDSLRKYRINEDNFLFTSQLGYKAVKHWYYSAMLQFKTQFFNNYKPNSDVMTAAFLSPGELNIGIGMTYDYKNADQTKTLTVAIAPLSYNLKICRDIDRLNPVNFGIDEGHHTKSTFGSNIEAKWFWKINPSITWSSRFYVFTNYHYVQGDWENTFDFSITSHLNTKIFTHLRYDKSHPYHADWHYWQFKEILSFGIVYRIATSD
jgi:hypothetical protein